MSHRRILSLWFPRLAAERAIRADPQLADQLLAVVAEVRGTLVLASLSQPAETAGLRRGMVLGDARAICPGLITRPVDPLRAAAFHGALRRWAGRFSPWVAEEGSDALVLDVTGCAHLFGGEAALAALIEAEAFVLGLTLTLGLADTVGAAWAVARFAGAGTWAAHAGDAIDQEARATRSRARKRRWERGGAPPLVPADTTGLCRIVPPGQMRAHLYPLPVAALRLAPDEIAALNAFGLRRVGDLAGLPGAQLARRVGLVVGRRLDQALGRAPETVSPARQVHVFALRLTFPEPIGLEADVLAGVDRLLGPLCARLRVAGSGARRVRLTLVRVDGSQETREVGLARHADDSAAIRPLLELKISGIDAGFGIEMLRLEALAVEPMTARQHRSQLAATTAAAARHGAAGADAEGMADLIGRLGARLGLEALTRLHPADSHVPEKNAIVMAAGFSEPATDWRWPTAPRPIVIFPSEPVTLKDAVVPPENFVWRRRALHRRAAFGPERIAPEWWLDDPAWRSGARDYWRVETEEGARIWLYEAKGGEASRGWFAQGLFA